jgi:glycosyltransferase involved in cell wall biosynthesis
MEHINQGASVARKKVLYLITKAVFGGAQRYVHDLATNLPQNEFEAGVAYGVRGKLSEMLETRGVPLLEIPSLGRDIALISDIRSFFGIRKSIRAAAPDILHLNSSKAAALGALAGRLLGVRRIVFTVHGWPFKESRGALSGCFLYAASYVTALLSTDVIVVSQSDEAIGLRMLGVGKKVVYIPLGRENLNVAAPQEAFKEMFGATPLPPITDTTIRIVSLAELTTNKGIRYGIECIAELMRRGVDAIYVVPGEGEERETLVALAGNLGVADRVFFPGFIPDAARYLSGFDVYLLPSIKEGMPYVLIEASLAGLPIVATDVIDDEFAEKLTRTKIVPARNPLALADAVVELAKLPQRSTHTINPFPLSEMIGKTLDVYRS